MQMAYKAMLFLWVWVSLSLRVHLLGLVNIEHLSMYNGNVNSQQHNLFVSKIYCFHTKFFKCPANEQMKCEQSL